MKKQIAAGLAALCLASCVTLTAEEQIQVKELKEMGLTVSDCSKGFEKPASPALAGFLNLLPGMGNLYLGVGEAAEPELKTVARQNVIVFIPFPIISYLPIPVWPVSILWSIPQTVSDAGTINERAMAAYYYKSQAGKTFLENLSDPTVSHKPEPKWVSKFNRTDRDYKYYVGRAEGETAKDALNAARQDAYDQAVREYFGVTITVHTVEKLDQEQDAVSVNSSEHSKGKLVGFERIDDYVFGKDGTYHASIYFRCLKPKN